MQRMRMKAVSAVLSVLSMVTVAAAEAPKLVGGKRVFPDGGVKWKKTTQYAVWAMRLSPDGQRVLYSRPARPEAKTPDGEPDRRRQTYELVLRDLSDGKDKVLPIDPLDGGWRTVFTRFNMFDPAGTKLILVATTVARAPQGPGLVAVRSAMTVSVYDIRTGKLLPTGIEDGQGLAKFDRTGKGLIVVQGMGLYRTPLGKTDLKPLKARGVIQSVCPGAEVICLWKPPRRIRPTKPGERPKRGPQALVLYDMAADKETATLPVHGRNSKLDDWETQWTADGRYLGYYDVKETQAAGPRERTRTVTRIWDRQAGKFVRVVPDAVVVGPGPTATTFVLAKADVPNRMTGMLLHDAKTGAEWPLGHTEARLIHASAGKILYAKTSADGSDLAYVARIVMSEAKGK